MARMTIPQAAKAWNRSRATIRKWIGDDRLNIEKIKIGERQDGKPIFLTLIANEAPPQPKTQRRGTPRKPKQALLPFPEAPSAPVAGIARSPRRRWPF